MLLPKKGHQNLLSNKRPITLLNAIYKVFTKVFQTHLTSVLQTFISLNQSVFLPNRSIHHFVLLTNKLLQQALEFGVDHIFLKLDICKAFNKLAFLYCLLKHLHFGHRSISFIKAISTLANSTVIVNGKQSDSFKISRSGRQGCPISPLLS